MRINHRTQTYVDYIALLQFTLVRYPMANHLVDGAEMCGQSLSNNSTVYTYVQTDLGKFR